MFAFDPKRRPAETNAAAPRPTSTPGSSAPAVNPLWMRLVTSTSAAGAPPPVQRQVLRESSGGREDEPVLTGEAAGPRPALQPMFHFGKIPFQTKLTVGPP